MFQFFDVITGFLDIIVNFVVGLLKMIGYFILFVVQGFAYVLTITAYLPPWVLPFVVAVIGFSVIMLIINK